MVKISTKIPYASQLPSELQPDLFDSNSSKVDASFVISRNSQGEVLSIFGDNIWDLTPYRTLSNPNHLRINFEEIADRQRNDVKSLIFRLIYFTDHGLSAYFIIQSVIPLKAVAKFAIRKNILPSQLICNESLLISFLREKIAPHNFTRLSAIVYSLAKISVPEWRVNGLSQKHCNLLKKRVALIPESNQTPVIPQRIFSNLLTQLTTFFAELEDNSSALIDLLSAMAADRYYGRAHTTQSRLGAGPGALRDDFRKAVSDHKLTGYFKKNNIEKVQDFGSHISKIYSCVQMLIAIFSGMRRSEVLNLTVGCLSIHNVRGEIIHRIDGITYKGPRKPTPEFWITEKRVEKPIGICEQISILCAEKLKIETEETPLFLSPYFIITDIALPTKSEKIPTVRQAKLPLELLELDSENQSAIFAEDDLRP